MYQPVSLGQLHLLPPDAAVRVLGQLEHLGRVLRSVTGEAELLGPLRPACTQGRVELWGQLVAAAPNQLLVHGLRPLAPQGPVHRRGAGGATVALRAAAGPFEGTVRTLHYGQTLLALDAEQRVYRLEWCGPGWPAPGGFARAQGPLAGTFHVQGEVLPQDGTRVQGGGRPAGPATLRVLRAWPLGGPRPHL